MTEGIIDFIGYFAALIIMLLAMWAPVFIVLTAVLSQILSTPFSELSMYTGIAAIFIVLGGLYAQYKHDTRAIIK